MGLIARIIESEGISTVVFSLSKELTLAVGVPRAVYVKWPLGHPLGEPGKPQQQRTMLFLGLQLAQTATGPGALVEPGFRWKREQYQEPDWQSLTQTTLQKALQENGAIRQ